MTGTNETNTIDFKGLTLYGRLDARNLLHEYNMALTQSNKPRLTEILQLVSLNENEIALILCKAGVY